MMTSNLTNTIWYYLSARRSSMNPQESRFELLSFLYGEKAGAKSNPEVIACLTQASSYVKGILSDHQERFLLDRYPEAVEACLAIGANGRDYAEYQLPGELSEYLYILLDRPKGLTFYNPFSGMCSIPLYFKDNHFLCEEISEKIWAASAVRMHAHGVDADIRRSDAVQSLSNTESRFVNVICCPPFGASGNTSTANIIAALYDHLSDNGCCVVVVEAGFLHSQDGADLKVRERLVRDRAIVEIDLLPRGLFPATGIQTAVMVITKRQNESVFMFDATLEFTLDMRNKPHLDIEDIFEARSQDKDTKLDVSYDKLLPDYNLFPRAYVRALDPGKEYVKLGDLVSFPTPSKQHFFSFESFIDTSSLVSSGVPVKAVRTFDKSFPGSMISNSSYYKITGSAIIIDVQVLSSFEYSVRVGYFDDPAADSIFHGVLVQHEFTVYAPNTLNVLVPKEGVSKEYLMLQLLESQEVKRQLESLLPGGFRGRIPVDTLRSIMIPMVSEKEQAEAVKEALAKQLSKSEQRMKDEYESFQRELRIRKHALSGKLSAISSKWNVLTFHMRNNGGHISDGEMIGRNNPIPVSTIMSQIGGYLKDVLTLVDNLAEVENDWGKPEVIHPQEFIEEYALNHRSSRYYMSVSGENDSESAFLFPKKALVRVFDNIVANANAHGFIDAERSDYQIEVTWYMEEGNTVIAISNNGAPFKKDARADMVFSFGYSSSLHIEGHAGIGGHEVKSIMEKYGGRVEFISSPDDDFTVTYRLSFLKH